MTGNEIMVHPCTYGPDLKAGVRLSMGQLWWLLAPEQAESLAQSLTAAAAAARATAAEFERQEEATKRLLSLPAAGRA